MPLLLLLALGAATIGIGFWYRRRRSGGITVSVAIEVVSISLALTLAVATGLVPSVYAAVGLGIAKSNGLAVDDIRPFLLPGTNVDEFIQATVIATTLLSVIALVEFVRMCAGKRR